MKTMSYLPGTKPQNKRSEIPDPIRMIHHDMAEQKSVSSVRVKLIAANEEQGRESGHGSKRIL